MKLTIGKQWDDSVKPKEIESDYLIVMNGPDDGRIFAITKTPMVIGRLDGQDVILGFDTSVSRTHAQLIREGNGYCIQDLNSSHGTTVDGKPVSGKVALRDGSMVGVGTTFLMLRIVSKQ